MLDRVANAASNFLRARQAREASRGAGRGAELKISCLQASGVSVRCLGSCWAGIRGEATVAALRGIAAVAPLEGEVCQRWQELVQPYDTMVLVRHDHLAAGMADEVRNRTSDQ